MSSATKTSCQTAKLTFIVGLPGSGKSKYAAKTFGGAVIIDDANRIPEATKLIEQTLLAGKDCIVIDPLLCYPHVKQTALNWLKEHKLTAQWLFFSNEPQACLNNIRRRQATGDDRKVIGFISEATKAYVPPVDAKIIPVYKP